MRFYNNYNGFTFISVIVAISILIVLLPFLSYLMQSISFTSTHDELSISTFFRFIRDDTILATHYEINHNVITFDLQTGEKATIAQYNNVIRRQVAGEGHEIYLRDVKNMIIEQVPFGFKITITSFTGDEYEKSFTFYE